MPPRKSPLTLTELLPRLRKQAELSLYELSQRSGINRSNLHRMESGVITDPSRETLNRIARALDVEPELLYDSITAADPDALPSLPTYFRTKYRLTDDEIAEVERIVEATGKKPRRPAKRNNNPKTN
jgi:transcriptional regulator with XRE-family HTH domain